MVQVKQYWGRPAILERIGYSPNSCSSFTRIVSEYCLPVWLKRKPGSFRWMAYTDEPAIVRWQTAMAALYRQDILDGCRNGYDRRYKAPTSKRKPAGT